MTAHSLLPARRGWLKAAGGVAAGAALSHLGLLSRPARAAGTATVLPIANFLAGQGQSSGQVPPAANFLDWFSRIAQLRNAPTPPVYVATVDYAGLENQAFNNAFGTTIDQINSKVIVQSLTDGSGNVSVRVLLYTMNANTWVIPLTVVDGQFPPDFSQQLITNGVLFGVRPYPNTSVSLAGACLGKSSLDITYITTPNNLFVDLATFATQTPSASLQSVGFHAQATGPLTPYYSSLYGVPQGTLGVCTVSQTGLIATAGTVSNAGKARDNSRVTLDGFPAELIDLHPLGK
jgi:hypothetical protein